MTTWAVSPRRWPVVEKPAPVDYYGPPKDGETEEAFGLRMAFAMWREGKRGKTPESNQSPRDGYERGETARREVLAILGTNRLTVNQLASVLGRPKETIRSRLISMEKLGLVARTQDGTFAWYRVVI